MDESSQSDPTSQPDPTPVGPGVRSGFAQGRTAAVPEDLDDDPGTRARRGANLRYEIKLLIPNNRVIEAAMWLRRHPAGFREVHGARQVNNLYLDTPDLDSLQDNHCGAVARSKLRLRWYGHHTRAVRGTLELKCKRDVNGWKLQQRLCHEKNLTDTRWTTLLACIRAEAGPRLRAELDARFWPTLINHYQRRYFLTADGHVRATLDWTVHSYDQRLSPRPNLTRRHPGIMPAIIELKADISRRGALAAAAAAFPVRAGRCSKYNTAMDALL